jgi:hypothetical protein
MGIRPGAEETKDGKKGENSPGTKPKDLPQVPQPKGKLRAEK